MKIRKDDLVKVLYGKDAGKTGKVLKVDLKSNRIVVEGVNQFRKHIKGDGQSKVSEVVSITKSMPISKVMLIDPKSGKPTRVKFEVKDGVKSRVSVKSNAAIDLFSSESKSVETKSVKESKSNKKTK